MSIRARFYCDAPVFYGRKVIEQGTIMGYAAIIYALNLKIPLPESIALVCNQNKKYQTDEWNIFPVSYLPVIHEEMTELEALYKQLVFALKYEGVNLLVFSSLIKHYGFGRLTELIKFEPTGQYSRRIWFLIEWISGTPFAEIPDLTKKGYVNLLDEKLQYAIRGEKSPRHMIINNLPGFRDFCPLIRKTSKLEQYIAADLSNQNNTRLKGIHKDTLLRTSAFLLLKDSKASFTIEGESPKSKRAARWGQVIGQAGTSDLSKDELKRLQQIVIENDRFVDMGFRKKGGFVGEHDRSTGEPIPEHISAKWQDIEKLTDGLIETNELLLEINIDAVIAATVIAFGFVFIHPFEDGNGRIHRYLIHHLLAKKRFSQQGIIFPVSASILNHIEDYKQVLESFSHPLLDFIEWKKTSDHNIEVQNDTFDFYRYFDATRQAEFLYDCVKDTIENIIPEEIQYLIAYDGFKRYLDDDFEMPDKMVALLIKFLGQNNGQLSKRAREKEFPQLTENEIIDIERNFRLYFGNE
ncbi:MAG: Fic family protein [Bacteroidota bacterium]|nr:Fic family protein [Bacteroidota bacterium]